MKHTKGRHKVDGHISWIIPDTRGKYVFSTSTCLSVSFIWKPSTSHIVANTSAQFKVIVFFMINVCYTERTNCDWSNWCLKSVDLFTSALTEQLQSNKRSQWEFCYYDSFYFSVPHYITLKDKGFWLMIGLTFTVRYRDMSAHEGTSPKLQLSGMVPSANNHPCISTWLSKSTHQPSSLYESHTNYNWSTKYEPGDAG